MKATQKRITLLPSYSENKYYRTNSSRSLIFINLRKTIMCAIDLLFIYNSVYSMQNYYYFSKQQNFLSHIKTFLTTTASISKNCTCS